MWGELCNLFGSTPLFFTVESERGMACTALSIFGSQALFLYPWSFTGPDPHVGRAVKIKYYLLLGGQVWLILEFSIEKPTVTHLNHILQNQFYQKLR